MTPTEIRLQMEHVTQKHVDCYVEYMTIWMKSCDQPDKGLNNMLSEMKKDKLAPNEQMRSLLASLHDWFAYGN